VEDFRAHLYRPLLYAGDRKKEERLPEEVKSFLYQHCGYVNKETGEVVAEMKHRSDDEIEEIVESWGFDLDKRYSEYWGERVRFGGDIDVYGDLASEFFTQVDMKNSVANMMNIVVGLPLNASKLYLKSAHRRASSSSSSSSSFLASGKRTRDFYDLYDSLPASLSIGSAFAEPTPESYNTAFSKSPLQRLTDMPQDYLTVSEAGMINQGKRQKHEMEDTTPSSSEDNEDMFHFDQQNDAQDFLNSLFSS
jgi:hypothetical protein